MLSRFFESQKRAERDASELESLVINHGADLKAVLKQRAEDDRLNIRDRRHWQRLLKKADRLAA